MVVPVQAGQSLQSVIDGLKDDGTPVVLKLEAGVWREKVTLCRSNTTMEGTGAGQTMIIWSDGAYDPYPDEVGTRGTFRSATLRTDGAHITLRNLAVVNRSGPRERAGQAIALYADGDMFLCEGVTLMSHQDTLFTAPLPPKEMQKNGFVGPKQYAPRVFQRHVYKQCTIAGDVDFIFGGAAAWFEDCEIITIDGRGDKTGAFEAYATAASTPEGQTFGYVFNHCRFCAGEGVPKGSTYLGRPWREYAKTVLLHCQLGEHIHPAGWQDWGKAQFPETGFYAEYACAGAGAQGQRAPFAHQLTAEEAAFYTLDNFLSADK